MRLKFASSMAAVIILVASQSGQAGAIIGAASVSSPQGDFGSPSLALVNIVNQSGLSANYASGVTDFATFTAGTTHDSFAGTGFTATESRGPQQFTFDLGAVTSIGGIAIWNTGSAGAVTQIQVYADSDGDFGNGLGAQLLAPTALGAAGPAQVFAFGAVSTRYVHVEGLASLQPPDYYGLAEVAFDQVRGTNPVPEPATLSLLGFGIAGMGLFARARRRT